MYYSSQLLRTFFYIKRASKECYQCSPYSIIVEEIIDIRLLDSSIKMKKKSKCHKLQDFYMYHSHDFKPASPLSRELHRGGTNAHHL